MLLNPIRPCLSFPCSSLRRFGVSTKFAELLGDVRPKENVSIQGWVQRTQTYAKKIFLKLNDGHSSHQIQAIVPRTICRNIWVGSAIKLQGKWIPSQGPDQEMEFLADECTFIGQPEDQIQSVVMGDNDVLRKIPHLRPKTEAFAAILRLRSHITHITHNFFDTASFYHIDTPMISENDCEGAGEVFSINNPSDDEFFGEHKPYLQVSGQLHLEAIASAIPSMYTLSPAFRADRSTGRFNLAEFRMLEVECAFVDSLDQLCALAESYLKFVIKRMMTEGVIRDEFKASEPLSERRGTESAADGQWSNKILSDCFAARLDQSLPRITFSDALHALGRAADGRERALRREEELALVDEFRGPVFVTHFPASHKPFYMRRTEDGQFTESFDLLAPFVGELAGGSVREWDPVLLSERLKSPSDRSSDGDNGGGDNKLDWYLELRRRGYPRSAGFGMGMDRLMQALVGIPNIRDTVAFPRSHNNIKC